MDTPTINLSSADVEVAPPQSGSGSTPSLSSSDVEVQGASQQQGPVNPYANSPSAGPSAWQKIKSDFGAGQDVFDQAAQSEPLDTSSVGGFVKSVGSNIGAGATRLLSPLVHPVGFVEGAALNSAPGLLYQGVRKMVQPSYQTTGEQTVSGFKGKPGGEAVANIPLAALALTGLGEADAAEGAEAGEAPIPNTPATPTPVAPRAPVAPVGGSGGGTPSGAQPGGWLEPSTEAGTGGALQPKPGLQMQSGSGNGVNVTFELKPGPAGSTTPLLDEIVANWQNNSAIPNPVAPPMPILSQWWGALRDAVGRSGKVAAAAGDTARADAAQGASVSLDEIIKSTQARNAKPPNPLQIGQAYVQSVLAGIDPTAAAAALGMTPAHQEVAHAAAFFTPKTTAALVPPPTSAPKPPTAPTQVQPPTAAGLQQAAQAKTIAEAAASAQNIGVHADQIAAGVSPPKPPSVPLPQGMDQGHLSQQTVNTAGQVISSLPAPMQPKAILEATGNLASWLFDRKTAIGPDGKVVNVDSQKAAQTTAVGIINDEVDRQAEQAKAAQQAQQDAAKEKQESAQQAQEERDEAIAPTEAPKKSTGNPEPVEIPDTPATQKARLALAGAPMDATSEQLDALIRRTATVTMPVRKAMVEEEIRRRANRQEDKAQAGMMGEAIPNGQSREELQRWADAVKKGEHPYVHIPANVNFKPAGVEDLTRTPVKGAGAFSGTYYHPKEIEAADIRKAARDKKDPQAALDALVAKFKGEEKPVELRSADVEPERSPVVSSEEPKTEQPANRKESKPRATSPAEYKKIKAALLARGLNPEDTETWGTAVAEEEAKLAEKPADEPVTLPPAVATGIAAIVAEQAAQDPTTTLDDVLRDKDAGNFVAQALVNDGILTSSADNVNPKTSLLTTSARAKVGDALLGELLSPEVIAQTPDFLKQKLLGCMGTIGIINSKQDEWNLQKPLQAAVENFNRHFKSEEAPDPGPVVTALVKALDAPLPAMRGMFSTYAIGADSIRDGYAPAGDPEKPYSAFNLAFGTELTQDQYEKGLKPAEKATEEPGRLIVKDLRSGATTVIPESSPAVESKPLAKGDKVTYRTNKGKERTGEVAWTDGKKVRITDNGSTVNKNVEDVKPIASPAAEAKPEPYEMAAFRTLVGAAETRGRFKGTIAQDEGLSVGELRVLAINNFGLNPEDAKTIVERYLQERPEAPASKPEPAKDATLVDALQLAFERGAGPKDYNGLKKIVAEFDGKEPDQPRMKQGQEAYEAMLNRVASEIVQKGTANSHEVFDRLTRLYEGQPNLSIRTSTSIGNQAYSTPTPLAFIADKFAGISWESTVYEPTAGNGALLIAANPEKTLANELDPTRAQTLEDEGFSVTRQDATTWTPTTRQDAVVANPPFGNLPGPVKVDGYSIVKLDHLIAAKALGAMKDAGKACIILGAGSREEAGEVTNAARPFFNWLYAHYNVVSDFELEGDLYSRQGASWPVRVIAIDGRVRSAKVSPEAATIPRLKTWGEVYDKAAEHLGSNLEGQRSTDNVAGGPVRGESTNQRPVPGTAAGPNRPADSTRPKEGSTRTGDDGGTELQPGSIQHSGRVPDAGVGSADSTVRPDGDVARSDRLAEGQSAPRVVRREPAKPDGHSANALSPAADAIVDESNQFQVTYRPHSSKKDVAVMAPKALIGPMQSAMDKIDQEVGDIDQWVSDQLGYPDVETMHQAFMGIQTDAIAAAIYQMQRGKAVIVADQTGVGKGRVAAAVIRWAELHGHTPVFITESAPLFSPMYADLQDIGSGQTISPLLFNADASITDPKTGTKIFQNPGAMRPVLDRIRETGELPKGRNAVFLTYSQINTDNRQQLTLQRIAPNAIFILDESHNAGGDSNTGNFLSEPLTASKGVAFLSATWAKRPDNLPLYAGMTDISIAIPDKERVADAIAAGGAPLQAVLTSLLAETGQFVRRERSFDGIEIKNQVDEKNKAEHTRISDKVTEVLRGIVRADAMYHNLDFERIQREAKKKGKSAGSKGVVVQHMEFSSIVHNMVKQLLLALKADDAADQIIAAIERGEKPVFALENTMGAFLDSYINGHNLKEGDSLEKLDYSKISDRALMRTRYYNETDQMGNKTRIEVPLDDLSPAVRAAYDETQALIDALHVDLPVSPIDHIRNKVEKAGYKIAEITGRSWRIDYSGDVPRLSTVPGIEKKDRVNTATQFNNGGLDALIINRAGSTGISLHASEKFRDQRQRHMIIGQPAGDVNIVMQILGRVNRTGQLVLPRYTFLVAALPAEQRPAINLAKKMKSLNANVSSNTRAATSVQAVDLMNKYGDRIVAGYLIDNPDMAKVLGLSADTNEKGEPSGNEGLAMKATGHSALLPVSQQQEFMDSISEAYTNYIDFLDETGQNDLEPKTYDYAARELHTERMYQGTDETSPFGQDANYGEYSIKRQGKPLTPEEVMAKIAETFGPAAMQLAPRERDTLAARQLADHMEELYKPYYGGLSATGSIDRAQQMRTRGRQLLNDYRVGTGLRVDINGEQYNGVVTNIEGAKKPSGNPYAPSALQFTIAVNSGLRQIKVPGSQMDAIVTSNLGRNADVPQLFKDYGTDRQKAKIITGNLLGAFGELKSHSKGRIISFTMDDGTSKLGILMPSKFDISTDVEGTYAMRTPEGAEKFLEGNGSYLQSSASEIGVFGPTNSRDEMEIRTKMSKSASGKFFLDPKLLETVQGGDFVSSGGLMKATVISGRELDALRIIMGKIALYAGTSHIEEARTLDEKAKAQLDKPKRPKSGSVTMSFLGAGSLDPLATKLLQPVVDYAKKAVANTWAEATSAVKRAGKSGKAMGKEVVAALFPAAAADTDALDIMGKALGEPALRLFEAGQFLHDVSRMLDSLPQDQQIEFVDRWQTGEDQPTQDLKQAQEFMQEVLSQQRMREQTAVNLGRRKDRQVELSDKANYFPNRYKVAPGGEKALTEEQQIARLGQVSRRPFEGSKAFMKQQRYTLKQAVADGGVPLGNPVEMLLRRLQEGAKFVAARYAWYNFKDQGLAMFLKKGKKLPQDYSYVDDKSGNVWRVVESVDGNTYPVETGRWIIQKDAARLLNNYLSVDHIKGSEVLSAFVKLKNFSTEMKLAISAFHWAYITIENMASGLSTGMDKVINQGVRGLDPTKLSAGFGDIAKSMLAPYTAIKRGGQMIQYARNPDEFLESPEGKKFAERYPDFPHLMELLFAGGLRWGVASQFQESFGDHCLDAWKNGEIGKGIGKFLPWLSHGIMAPLFEHYIPRSKWAFAVELLSTKLAQYSYAIAQGDKTEEEIAREVAETTDNRFGELNWDSLYLNNDIKGALQFFFRSATWAIGSWRGAYQAVKEQVSSKMFDDRMFQKFDEQAKKGDWISQARKATSRLPQLGVNAGWILSMAMLTSTLGSVTEKLATDKFPWEWAKDDAAKNGISIEANAALEAMHPRTGAVDEHGEPVRVSWPTGLKDYEHGAENPGRYLKGKVSDVAVNAWDSIVQNRDFYGNYVYNPNDPFYKEIWQGVKYNAVGDLTPMSADNWLRPYGPQDTASKVERFTGMVGGAPKSMDRSHALTEALALHEVADPHTPLTPERQAELDYSKEHPTQFSIRTAAREKSLTYLDKVFKELSYTDAKTVYDDPKTSPAERVELKPFLDRKRIDAIRSARRK